MQQAQMQMLASQTGGMAGMPGGPGGGPPGGNPSGPMGIPMGHPFHLQGLMVTATALVLAVLQGWE